MSAPSAGALRAAERIGKLAGFPPIMVNALAEMIDAETASKELAEALRVVMKSVLHDEGERMDAEEDWPEMKTARQALAKYEARQ